MHVQWLLVAMLSVAIASPIADAYPNPPAKNGATKNNQAVTNHKKAGTTHGKVPPVTPKANSAPGEEDTGTGEPRTTTGENPGDVLPRPPPGEENSSRQRTEGEGKSREQSPETEGSSSGQRPTSCKFGASLCCGPSPNKVHFPSKNGMFAGIREGCEKFSPLNVCGGSINCCGVFFENHNPTVAVNCFRHYDANYRETEFSADSLTAAENNQALMGQVNTWLRQHKMKPFDSVPSQ